MRSKKLEYRNDFCFRTDFLAPPIVFLHPCSRPTRRRWSLLVYVDRNHYYSLSLDPTRERETLHLLLGDLCLKMAPSDENGASGGGPVNLFDYTEDDLMVEDKLTHYEILNVPHHATPDQVKKAYRKSSLKYHPDKTGRGQEDYVFLAVKRAYDHLMDPVKRQVGANRSLLDDGLGWG